MASTRPLLFDDDILHEIFQLLPTKSNDDPEDHKRTDLLDNRVTLAQCARVCKAYNGPALDHLWRYLPYPQLLLNCLPSVDPELCVRLLCQVHLALRTKRSYFVL